MTSRAKLSNLITQQTNYSPALQAVLVLQSCDETRKSPYFRQWNSAMGYYNTRQAKVILDEIEGNLAKRPRGPEADKLRRAKGLVCSCILDNKDPKCNVSMEEFAQQPDEAPLLAQRIAQQGPDEGMRSVLRGQQMAAQRIVPMDVPPPSLPTPTNPREVEDRCNLLLENVAELVGLTAEANPSILESMEASILQKMSALQQQIGRSRGDQGDALLRLKNMSIAAQIIVQAMETRELESRKSSKRSFFSGWGGTRRRHHRHASTRRR